MTIPEILAVDAMEGILEGLKENGHHTSDQAVQHIYNKCKLIALLVPDDERAKYSRLAYNVVHNLDQFRIPDSTKALLEQLKAHNKYNLPIDEAVKHFGVCNDCFANYLAIAVYLLWADLFYDNLTAAVSPVATPDPIPGNPPSDQPTS